MTAPSDLSPNSEAIRRLESVAMGVAALLIALKAFALGASGSVSALAGLTESGLIFIGVATSLFGDRWRALLPASDAVLTEAMFRLVLSGMTMASATFVGVIALFGIFDPPPVGGGLWPVMAVVVGLALAAAMIPYERHTAPQSDGHGVGYTDLVPNIVVLIGVAAGSVMNAPGLDAAAALVVAVWLFWGAFAPIRRAVVTLGVRPTAV